MQRLVVVTRERLPVSGRLDRGDRWEDPELGIRWPVTQPILSGKDASLPALADADHGLVYGALR